MIVSMIGRELSEPYHILKTLVGVLHVFPKVRYY